MNRTGTKSTARAALAAILLAGAGAGAAQEAAGPGPGPEPFAVYGYTRILAGAYGFAAPEGSLSGAALRVRLKADWEPSERLSFRLEADYGARYGGANEYARLEHYGIPTYLGSVLEALGGPSSESGDLYPYEDFHSSLTVDHAYGRANFGPLDLAFGTMPIAWGTAYVFNPTARAVPAGGLEPASEETPGIAALAPSLALGPGISIQAYLAFQDRSLRSASTLEEGRPENLPFGIKIQAVVGSFDLSFSFLREVIRAETLSGTAAFERRAWAGMDFSGALGPFGVYGEAALGLPSSVLAGTGPGTIDPVRDLEASVGFYGTVPGIEVEVRGEYHYRGSGPSRPEDYDPAILLSGESSVLGRHYVFLHGSRTLADWWTLSFAGLANAADGSWILLPRLSWEAGANLEIEAGALIPFGPEGSEFDGRRDLSAYGLGMVDLTEASAFAGLKMSF
mgnify:CR=1 FL=1